MLDGKDKNRRGFTLVEVLVVIVIMAILLSFVTLDFKSYQIKYKIDAQTKQMAADFNDIRISALQRKSSHGLSITPTSYTLLRYSSETDTASGAGQKVYSKNVPYRITKLDGTLFSNPYLVKFDERGYVFGITAPSFAIGIGAGNAPNDCLVMSVTRVNIGKLNGGVCEYK